MAPGRPRVPGLRAQELTHSRSNRAPRAAGPARSRLRTAPPRAARTTREPESVLRGLAAAGVRGAGPRENGGASTGEAAPALGWRTESPQYRSSDGCPWVFTPPQEN
ncbi:uncharacterized protein LOC144310198 [Canis aureus]